MKFWLKAVLAGAAIAAGTPAALAHGVGSTAAHSGTARGAFRISSHPFRLGFAPFDFRPAFPHAQFGQPRFEGWSGGAYSSDAVASEDEGIDPDNMIFRVQEPFGPGDLGLPRQALPPREDPGWYAAGPMPPPDYEPQEYGPPDRR